MAEKLFYLPDFSWIEHAGERRVPAQAAGLLALEGHNVADLSSSGCSKISRIPYRNATAREHPHSVWTSDQEFGWQREAIPDAAQTQGNRARQCGQRCETSEQL
ncbi:MAG TPA: hypothetical protein VG077_11240 [Verrucomicrobiae bacterium]|nr:hypothetical protein [Verrucomicrobiae bacterium]